MKKRSEVELDKKAREGVLEIEGEIYKRTGVSSTGSRLKKIRMEVDVSDYTTGRVLSMECEDRQWRLVV